MKEQLEQIKQQAIAALDEASTPAALEELRVRYLGKKGEVTAVLKQMGSLSAEERPIMGQLANNVRAEIEAKLDERKTEIHAAVLEQKLAAEALDVTIPGTPVSMGRRTTQKMCYYSTYKNKRHRNKRYFFIAVDRINNTVCIKFPLRFENSVHTGNCKTAKRQEIYNPWGFAAKICYVVNTFMKKSADDTAGSSYY